MTKLVLLQTAKGVITNIYENKGKSVRILFDSSQPANNGPEDVSFQRPHDVP